MPQSTAGRTPDAGDGELSGAASRRPTVSVVIPAHDEERPLERTLRALATQDPSETPDVVVVANGCSDGTADVARAAGVRVLELDEASKTAALNAGDDAVSAFPRIYLDADVTLTPGTLGALAAGLRRDGVLVAAPRITFDVSRSTWPVRAFYAVYRELPYVRDGLVGLGVYGLSAAGRARFDRFPEVTSDDLFVQRLFDRHERATTDGEFVVAAPRDVRNLVNVRIRTARGNSELSAAGVEAAAGPRADRDEDGSPFARTTSSTVGALARLAVRRPQLIPSVAVYAAVTVVSRVAASRRQSTSWQRDLSTR